MRKISLPVMLAAALMMIGLPLAMALKPTKFIADAKPILVLEEVVPLALPSWQELKDFRAAIPDPTVKEVIDATYSQTLTRAYINSKGQVMMLTLAYGRDQNSEATAAHRPEFCYAGNGFHMTDLGTKLFNLGNRGLTVRHMLAQRDAYQEKISYWVTLDETATLPGLGRKLAQFRYGLSGRIADGMLVRLSSPNMTEEEALQAHAGFLSELSNAVSTGFRSRIFGG
jgi:EpsI family protein